MISARYQRFVAILGFGALLLASPSLSVGAQNRHLVTFDDMSSSTLKLIDYQMEVSPDGETLAYSIMSEDSLWLLNIKQGITRKVDQGTMPRWSPDGTQLAFYSKQSGSPQLWILDLKTDQARQITNLVGGINPDPVARFLGWIGDPLRYCWSPDGTKIVFTSRANAEKTKNPQLAPSGNHSESSSSADQRNSSEEGPLVLTNTSPPSQMLRGLFRDSLHSGSESSERNLSTLPNQLFVVDIRTKSVEQLTKDDLGYFNPDWSPDGTKIVFVSTEGRPMAGYGPDTSNLYEIDISTDRKTALTEGSGQKRLPSWSPDGKWVAYKGDRKFGISSVYVLPSKGGDPINITAQLDRSVFFTFYWAPDSKSILLSYWDAVSFPIARVFVPSARIQRLTQSDVICYPFAISREAALLWAQSDGSSQSVLYSADSEGHNAHALLDLNPQMKQWMLGKQEIVRWKNSRGEENEGILIKPVDYQEGKTYPLIVDPYPGQANRFFGAPMLGNQGFASMGYAVFFPNERTPHTWENPVKGQTYNEATRGPTGVDIMMDDLMTGIDAVVKRGVADPDRMCLYGFSNGGGAVNLIVTQTSRFKCAVSAAGVGTDWAFSFFFDPETFRVLIGGTTPWENPNAYVTLSPVYHLDKVTTPMLLAIGDEEETGVVMLAEMYNGLRYLGRDVTFLRYPKQGHGFTGLALKDYWQRVNAFFDKYLRPERPPKLTAGVLLPQS